MTDSELPTSWWRQGLVRFTGLSLKWQICAFTCLAILISLIAMGWIAFSQSAQILTDMQLDSSVADSRSAVARIEQFLEATRVDVLQTPQFPPVPGIIRCEDNDGVDPEQAGSDKDVWAQRLTTIVTAQMRQRPERVWTAYVTRSGEEIMRVERRGSEVARTMIPVSDFRSDSFFQTAMRQTAGQVATSKIELAGDRPELRMATPCVDSLGTVRGVFLIALDAAAVLKSGAESISQRNVDSHIDIVDENGRYLHSDESPEYAFSSRRYEQDKPVRAKLLSDPQSDDSYREVIDGSQRPDGVSLLGSYQKFFYVQDDPSRFWAIAPSIQADKALAPVNSLARRFLLLGLIIIASAAGVTLIASHGLTAALSTVTQTANQIATGNLNVELPPVRPLGEVRTLAESVRAMTASLRDSLRTSREQEKRTSAILNSTADAILTLDVNGVIQSANSAASRLFGTTNGDLVGSSGGRFVPALTSSSSHYSTAELSDGEVRILGGECEVTGRRSDGTELPIAMRVCEMEHAGDRLFIATLQDITERHAVEIERQGIFEAITAAVERLGASSSEIQAQTTEQAATAQQQAASVAETSSTVKEITETARESMGKAEHVAGSARRANEVSRAGSEAVEETISAMREVQEQSEGTAQNILMLAERAQAISNIITTVNEIADQTNLLALNAAIEASRAGEHGKGFAVVATEVKALADQSKKATEQVRQILGEIQQATNTAVMSTEQGTRSVAAAQQVVGKARQTITELSQTISEAARSAQQIVASSGQQATGMQQIRDAMSHIDTSTRQTLAASRQTEAAAHDLAQLGEELRTLTRGTRDG